MQEVRWREWAAARGYRVAFGHPRLAETAARILEGRRSRGEIDAAFAKAWIDDFKDTGPLEGVRSLAMVAVPRPAHTLSFVRRGIAAEAVIPPTYVDYRPVFDRIRRDVKAWFIGERIGIGILSAPLKTLAALTGLADYGRNNVTYVAGLGSYHQLVGLKLNVPIEGAGEGPPRALEDALMGRCADCRACANACPQGAIEVGRFLLRPERCYTTLSELPGDLPEPCRPPSTDCVVGCLRCQLACPVNRGLLKYEPVAVSLSEEETEAVAAGLQPETPVERRVLKKIHALGLSEAPAVYLRNLRLMILNGWGRAPTA